MEEAERMDEENDLEAFAVLSMAPGAAAARDEARARERRVRPAESFRRLEELSRLWPCRLLPLHQRGHLSESCDSCARNRGRGLNFFAVEMTAHTRRVLSLRL